MYKKIDKKSLPCKVCNETVENVGHEATAVTCSKCVNEQLRGLPILEEIDDLEQEPN